MLKEKLLVIDADYVIDESGPAVRLFCKDTRFNTVLVRDATFVPYLYILPKKGKTGSLKKKIEHLDTKKIGTKILRVEIVEKNWMNEWQKFLKVFVDNPRQLQDVRHAAKRLKDFEGAFEYDLTLYRRYLLDKQIEPLGWIEASGRESKGNGGMQVDRVIEATSVRKVEVKKEIKLSSLSFDTEWVEGKGKSRLIMMSIADSGGYKKVLTTHEWSGKPK